jgi:hypothetical protein
MFNVIKIQTRPTTSTPFFCEIHTPSDEYTAYFKEKYAKTKKWIKSKSELSEDQLSFKVVTSWNSQDDFINFVSDEYIINNSISINQKHDAEHQIYSIYSSEEI